MERDRTAATATTRDSDGRTTRRRALKAVGTVGATLLAGCTVSGDVKRASESVEYSVDGSEVDEIAVSGDDGDTVVRGSDGDELQVEATKYALGDTDLSEVTVTREVVNGRLDIEADVTEQGGIGTFGGGLESLEVTVPQGTTVSDVSIDDGDLEVADVSGDLTLDVDDGFANVGPVSGSVDATVDDGTVTLGAVDSVTGEVDDGTIEMDESAAIGDFESDDGLLELAVADLDDDVTIRGDDGDITLQLAAELDATVVIDSDDSAPVEFDGSLFENVRTSEKRIRGQMGDGTHEVTIDVDDGAVDVGAI